MILDSDQKEFANFGGFDINQQEVNNQAGWGDFENNFKQNNFDQNIASSNQQNQGFKFGGFDDFKF